MPSVAPGARGRSPLPPRPIAGPTVGGFDRFPRWVCGQQPRAVSCITWVVLRNSIQTIGTGIESYRVQTTGEPAYNRVIIATRSVVVLTGGQIIFHPPELEPIPIARVRLGRMFPKLS